MRPKSTLLTLKVGASPKPYGPFSGQVDDVRVVSLSYTAYEDGSRTIAIVGDSTGIKTTLHLKIRWLQNGGEIQIDEQNPFFPDHNFNYGQIYVAEARFAEQFVRLNGLDVIASASHD